MKYFKSIFIMTLCLFMASLAMAGPSKLSNLIPLEMEKQGWVPEDEPFIAMNEEALTMIINGAAPRYMELGTQQAAFVNYEKGPAFLMLEIYETSSENDADAVYREFKTKASAPVKDLGKSARLTSEMGGTLMLEYYQERFYVRISITQKTDQAKNELHECAGIISKKIAD